MQKDNKFRTVYILNVIALVLSIPATSFLVLFAALSLSNAAQSIIYVAVSILPLVCIVFGAYDLYLFKKDRKNTVNNIFLAINTLSLISYIVFMVFREVSLVQR